jgi:hypothetical protein
MKTMLERITINEQGEVVCPNEFPHDKHTNAVWTDWQECEVWTCSGN